MALLYFKNGSNAYAAKTSLPLNQLQAFSEVYLKIKQNYKNMLCIKLAAIHGYFDLFLILF